jgi:peptide/nickel transport system substrate-binding protein
MLKKIFFVFLVLFLVITPLIATSCDDGSTTIQDTEGKGGDWWSVFGEPEYGGELTVRVSGLESPTYDPGLPMGTVLQFWLEGLFAYDWRLDRDTWSYTAPWTSEEYLIGALVDSWEYTDPTTWTLNIRKGIYWQDKPPVNGREFTAEDIQYNYDRLLGTGSGFTEPNQFYGGMFTVIERVVATEKYKVQIKLKEPAPPLATIQVQGLTYGMAPHEWLELGEEGQSNWENAVGTGPWMLTDVVLGTSMTFSPNPNYWGYDERYTQNNKLPYLDELRVLAIQDETTARSALRTGRIDILGALFAYDNVSIQNAVAIEGTNPDINIGWRPSGGVGLFFRCDTAPFNDIRVRQALQMAFDREAIASSVFAGTVDGTPCGLSSPLYKGWAVPYEDWPENLQNTYSFNQNRAKELLAEAAADGVFKPNNMGGFDTNVVTSPAVTNMEVMQAIQGYFSDIGVNMEITSMDRSAFMSYAMSGKHDQMAAVLGGTGMLSDPVANVKFLTTGNRSNFSFNNDQYFDDLADEFSKSTTLDEAKEIYQQIEIYALEKNYMLSTFSTDIPVMWQPYVKGYSGETIIRYLGGNILARLWIDQNLKEEMK